MKVAIMSFIAIILIVIAVDLLKQPKDDEIDRLEKLLTDEQFQYLTELNKLTLLTNLADSDLRLHKITEEQYEERLKTIDDMLDKLEVEIHAK